MVISQLKHSLFLFLKLSKRPKLVSACKYPWWNEMKLLSIDKYIIYSSRRIIQTANGRKQLSSYIKYISVFHESVN